MSADSAIMINNEFSPKTNCITGLKIDVIKYKPNPIISINVFTCERR